RSYRHRPDLHSFPTRRSSDLLKKATYLNEDGTYRFDSIPSGIYTVAVIIPDNTTVKHKLVHQGEHSTLDIVLDVNVGKLNDHIVWARSKKAEIEMAGYAANVIETGRAALQNIQTNELLDRTAGVRIRQIGRASCREGEQIEESD